MQKATLKKKLLDKLEVLIPKNGEYEASRPNNRLHKGIDFMLVKGSKVYALMDGLLENKSFAKGQLEVWVTSVNGVEQHRNVHLSRFGHPNGRVKQGSLIGYTGDTGSIGSFHLHFERRLLDRGEFKPVDPTPYLLEEDAMVGKPTPSIGQVTCEGSPELINDAGDKSGNYAGFEAVVPFDAIRGGKFDTPKGNIEYRSIYRDKGIVWVHCNDVKTDLTISGHVEPEKVIAEQEKQMQDAVKILEK